MDIDIAAWLGLALRWLHLITGIAWIGSSFYFIWLDNALRPPADPRDREAGASGEVWAVHGGGFYHKQKYPVAPAHMPAELHWFKWEAYFTWLSGFALLALIYYASAELYLIDRSRLDLAPWQAIAISLGCIVGGWLAYDGLCRSPLGRDNRLFAVVWFALLTAAAWALTQVFSDRGAFIHVGVIMGTAMAANVFMLIIPNQKKVVADLLAGRSPDPRLGQLAKQRSLHNNYMTLPVLLVMIASHYPMLQGHAFNWLLLAGLGAVAWLVRHFFNLRHKGRIDYRFPVAGALGFVIIAVLASYRTPAPDAGPGQRAVGSAVAADTGEVRRIIRERCIQCHSDTPSQPGFAVAPLGVMYDKLDEIVIQAPRIKAQAVDTRMMPPGNLTGMTDQERQALGEWIDRLGGSGE
ncbi:MAG: urate hydroxylase PuuD [Xanthomonadaceae bacterium]|nr:urate hydroxylase PuuD [Xanthomonadaceae bacterium]